MLYSCTIFTFEEIDKSSLTFLPKEQTQKNKRAQRALGRSPEEKVKGKKSQWSHLQSHIVHEILIEHL